jgi:hypothetical protein
MEESDMAESSSSISAVGRSGESVRQVGPYISDSRIPLVVFLRPGDRFPGDAEAKAVSWTLLKEELRAEATQPV